MSVYECFILSDIGCHGVQYFDGPESLCQRWIDTNTHLDGAEKQEVRRDVYLGAFAAEDEHRPVCVQLDKVIAVEIHYKGEKV